MTTPPGRRLGLAGGTLLLVSAALQGSAAVQRWVFTDESSVGPDRTIEDHLFDYVIPADPWVSIGSAATLFGLGYLLIGASLICVGVAHRAIAQRAAVIVVAAFAAAPFVVLGVHALVSGLLSVASPLQGIVVTYGALVVGVYQVVLLVVFAALLVRRSWLWAVGVLALNGTTVVGYLLALFWVAPALVGYQSYDTTPWSEAVLAAVTALAGIAVLAGALRLRAAAATV